MIPPKVYNFNKKTCIANYVEFISKHKSFFNLQNFILEELYTIGNLDFKNRLILKGKFKQLNIQNILTNYIKKFILCEECKSFNTNLGKNKMYKLICNDCKSEKFI